MDIVAGRAIADNSMLAGGAVADNSMHAGGAVADNSMHTGGAVADNSMHAGMPVMDDIGAVIDDVGSWETTTSVQKGPQSRTSLTEREEIEGQGDKEHERGVGNSALFR
jgi:hypothetical protein